MRKKLRSLVVIKNLKRSHGYFESFRIYTDNKILKKCMYIFIYFIADGTLTNESNDINKTFLITLNNFEKLLKWSY